MPKFIDRTGETNTANNGQQMKIIKYNSSDNITVEFEDKTIVENKRYADFKSGRIANPNYSLVAQRVGETNTALNGQTMKIIEYNSYDDITVEFEDKTVVKTTYKQFKLGCVRNKNAKEYTKRFNKAKEEWLGRVTNTVSGKCKIISYRGYNDITVQFEDGSIRKSDIKSFQLGTIKNPKQETDSRLIKKATERIGQTIINKQGLKCKIIDYKGTKNITVEFEDGSTIEGVSYSSFLKGEVKKNTDSKDTKLGETRTMKNGLQATIIGSQDSNNLTIRFENGEIRQNIRYTNFIRGNVGLEKPNRLGEKNTFYCGLSAEIIDYKSSTDMTVRFEDGEIVKGVQYSSFKQGQLKHPTITTKGTGKLKTFTLIKRSYTSKNQVFYECKCWRCGLEGILTPQEMIQHKCK